MSTSRHAVSVSSCVGEVLTAPPLFFRLVASLPSSKRRHKSSHKSLLGSFLLFSSFLFYFLGWLFRNRLLLDYFIKFQSESKPCMYIYTRIIDARFRNHSCRIHFFRFIEKNLSTIDEEIFFHIFLSTKSNHRKKKLCRTILRKQEKFQRWEEPYTRHLIFLLFAPFRSHLFKFSYRETPLERARAYCVSRDVSNNGYTEFFRSALNRWSKA